LRAGGGSEFIVTGCALLEEKILPKLSEPADPCSTERNCRKDTTNVLAF